MFSYFFCSVLGQLVALLNECSDNLKRREFIMASFKLYKLGQSAALNEFRGNGLSQNGQYLQILGPNNNVLVSLILEPGYCLADISVIEVISGQELANPGALRTLRA